MAAGEAGAHAGPGDNHDGAFAQKTYKSPTIWIDVGNPFNNGPFWQRASRILIQFYQMLRGKSRGSTRCEWRRRSGWGSLAAAKEGLTATVASVPSGAVTTTAFFNLIVLPPRSSLSVLNWSDQ